MVASLFERGALFLGRADVSNPYGHFEDLSIVRFHEELLRANGVTWQAARPFVPVVPQYIWDRMVEIVEQRAIDAADWGFKDPRVCLFLPVWKWLLPDAKVLIVVRHPCDVIDSIKRRHAALLVQGEGAFDIHLSLWTNPDLAAKMWLMYSRCLLRFGREWPDDSFWLDVDQLAARRALVDVIAMRWGFELKRVPNQSVIDSNLKQKNRKSLRLVDPNLRQEVVAVWNIVRTQVNREDWS